MPGAGKSTIADGLKSRGFEIINMGDEVRAEARNRGVEPTAANLGRLMFELRERNGEGAIAELVKDRITRCKSDAVIIDGIRSNAEIGVLRKYGTVKLLAVHASAETRFGFISRRGRSDDPQTRKNFEDRDSRELDVGISSPIALSEEIINNNNTTRDELVGAALKKIERWLK